MLRHTAITLLFQFRVTVLEHLSFSPKLQLTSHPAGALPSYASPCSPTRGKPTRVWFHCRSESSPQTPINLGWVVVTHFWGSSFVAFHNVALACGLAAAQLTNDYNFRAEGCQPHSSTPVPQLIALGRARFTIDSVAGGNLFQGGLDGNYLQSSSHCRGSGYCIAKDCDYIALFNTHYCVTSEIDVGRSRG